MTVQAKLEDVGVGSKRSRPEAEDKNETKQPPREQEGEEKREVKGEKEAANGAPALDPQRALPIKGDAKDVKGDCEEGRIFFLYRPRVGLEDAQSISDVQRFFMVLSPTSRKEAPNRLVVIGKKRLPDAAKKERFYGFIQTVSNDMGELMGGMDVKEYSTKTQGERRTEAARIVGEGVYSIAEKGSDVRLAYTLEVPNEPGHVHDELKIPKEATFKLSVKNPDTRGPSYASRKEKPDYPPEKKQQFEGPPGGYNWVSPKDCSLLDYANVELLLIATHDDLGTIPGELKDRLEGAAEADKAAFLKEHQGTDEDSALIQKAQGGDSSRRCPH